MDLKPLLNKLKNYVTEKPHRVFTMYLNTDPADPDQQGGEWKIHLKNGLKNFESYVNQDGNPDEKKNFAKVKEKVENYMKEYETKLKKSVVIFATANEDIWFAERLQVPVKSEFYWEEQPVIDQLKSLHNNYPKTGIILTQKNQVKCIDAELGTVNDTVLFELDLDSEDWRKQQDRRQEDSEIDPNEEIEQRFDANRTRWYKRIVPKLERHAKNHNWQQIYLVGESQEINDLESHMNKNIDGKINKNLLDHDETKVLEEVV